MPEASAREETRRGASSDPRGGIRPLTAVSDQREEESGVSRERPNAGKRRQAVAVAGDAAFCGPGRVVGGHLK